MSDKMGDPGTSNQRGRGRAGQERAAAAETLTPVVLHVIHRHVGGHEGRLAVFLLVLLLCQQPGLGILRGNDVFNFSTKGRKEPGHTSRRRTSGPQTDVSGEARSHHC